MRFDKARIAMVAAALFAVLLPTTALAGWFSSDEKEVSLQDLLKDAAKYTDEKVTFRVYFNALGDEYNAIYTRFDRVGFGNFGAWPMDARLYTKRDFQRCYPHFYAKRNSPVWEDIQDLERFDVIEVKAHVTHIFKGRPHLEILEVDEVSDGMDEDEIRSAIKGHAHYLAGHYGRAVELYRRAITNDVPALVQADLHRRLGDARYMSKRYSDAKASYKKALRLAPDSAVLKRNIAACDQAYGRKNGNSQAQIEPTKYIAHHLVDTREDMSNGVDLIIAALEDPKKVREADEQEKLDLAARSVHGTKGRKTVTVSDSKPAEEPMQDEKVAAAEAESEDSAEDPVDEEKLAEEAEAAAEAKAAEEAAAAKAAEEAAAAKAAEEAAAAKAAEEAAAAKAAEEAAAAKAAEEAAAAKAAEEAAAAKAAEEARAAEEAAAAKAAEEAAAAKAAEEANEPEAVEPAAEESMDEQPAEERVAEDAADLDPADAEEMPLDESNPRVLKVGDTLHLLPRMPFYGCATVSYEQFRAVVEEIMDTDDDLMVDGFESPEMNDEPLASDEDESVEDSDDMEDSSEGQEQSEEPEVEEPTTEEPVAEPEKSDDE